MRPRSASISAIVRSWSRGELERERGAVGGDELARLAERLRGGLLAHGCGSRKRQAQDEQLVERETYPPDLRLGKRTRPVQRGERVGPQRKPLASAQLRRQRLSGVADEAEHLRAQLAELLLRDVLARGIDRREVGGLDLALEVVRGHGEAELVRPPAEPDPGPGREPRLEPRLVEPGRVDVGGLVRDARRQDLEAPAPAARRRPHDDLDRGLLLAEEVADPLRRNRLLVAPRPLPEQVPDALEARVSRAASRPTSRRRRASRRKPRGAPAAGRSAAAARRKAALRPRTGPAAGQLSSPRARGHYRSRSGGCGNGAIPVPGRGTSVSRAPLSGVLIFARPESALADSGLAHYGS